MSNPTFERTASRIKVARLLDELTKRTMSAPEVAHYLSLSLNQARRYLSALRKGRQIHIARWLRSQTGGAPSAVYAAGEGKDAPRPVPISSVEATRRWWKKVKRDDPAKYEVHLAKARQRYRNRTFKPRPDVAAAWLFKEAA